MELRALKSLLGKVRDNAPNHTIIVFGSSALFAAFPDEAPAAMGVEVTIDADLLVEPEDPSLRARLSDQFGPNNEYHINFGYYGDFVDFGISETFPPGWKARLVPFPDLTNVWGIDPVDMAATKLLVTAGSRLARRMGHTAGHRGTKDIDIVAALLSMRHIDLAELRERIATFHLEEKLLVKLGQVVSETMKAAALDEKGA